MRTNIELDDQLVNEAFKFTTVKTKRDLVELALIEFINNHKRKDVRDLIGKIKIDPKYNYKKLRSSRK